MRKLFVIKVQWHSKIKKKPVVAVPSYEKANQDGLFIGSIYTDMERRVQDVSLHIDIFAIDVGLLRLSPKPLKVSHYLL